MIALQYCVGFCHTSTWSSHRQTYVPSLSNLPATPTLSRPSGLSQTLPASCSKLPLAVYFTRGRAYASLLLSPVRPILFPPRDHSWFSVSGSTLLPCKQVQQYHLSKVHMCVLIYDMWFSLSDLLHSIWYTLGSSTSLELTQMHSLLWLNIIYIILYKTM